MITVSDAFWKFRGRLETTDTEDATASRRQQKLRGQLDEAFDIITDFLTGAYRRHTKTKPLRDVDIMIVLRDTSYLDMHPREILEAVRKVLAAHYGAARVCTDRRAVRVDFGVEHVDDLTGEVISFDVVPAFEDGDHYLIPDDHLGIWIPTNPKIHAELATTANKNFDGQWKPLVKMIKKWNQVHGGPVEPGFLIEVMALELITGTWTGSHAYELRAVLRQRRRPDRRRLARPGRRRPRHLRRPGRATRRRCARARAALREAEAACTRAILLDRQGRTGEALSAVAVPVRRPVPPVMTTASRPVPAGSSGRIRERQDQPEHLRRLLAYSHLYAVAQRWHRARAFGTIPPGHRRAHHLAARPVHQRHPRRGQRRVAGRRPDRAVLAGRPPEAARRPRPGAVRHQAVQPALEHRPGRPRTRPRGRRRRSRAHPGRQPATATGTASTSATRPGPATSCSASG